MKIINDQLLFEIFCNAYIKSTIDNNGPNEKDFYSLFEKYVKEELKQNFQYYIHPKSDTIFLVEILCEGNHIYHFDIDSMGDKYIQKNLNNISKFREIINNLTE